MVKGLLPQCGLYRTTKPLADHETDVPAGVLVYFHNHTLGKTGEGLPVVVVPEHNVHNRWHFHGSGIEFRSLAWADSLVHLPREGFYGLRKPLEFEGGTWPKGTLVQLGYTRAADPILFIAQQKANPQVNNLFFSERGVSVGIDQLGILEPLSVFEEPAEHGTGQH